LVLVFALLVLPVFWSGTQVYAQLGFVTGEILDEQGNPVKDVTVRIEGMDTPRKYKVKSDKKGKYVHAGVAIQGLYRVIVEKDGFQTEYQEGIRPGFTRDDTRGIVNFKMKPGKSGPMAFEMTPEQIEAAKKAQEEAQKQAAALESVRADFNAGIAAFNAGQFAEAAAAFEKVVAVEPNQAVIWANLAASYSKGNQTQKAIDAYDKAIALEPENASYYQNQGSAYATLGNQEKARELYEKAATLAATASPKDAAVNYYNMGVTYINAGKNQEAADALQKAIAADPTHAEAHYQLGITYIGLGKMDDAMKMLKKYVEMAPAADNAEVAKALIQQLGGQ